MQDVPFNLLGGCFPTSPDCYQPVYGCTVGPDVSTYKMYPEAISAISTMCQTQTDKTCNDYHVNTYDYAGHGCIWAPISPISYTLNEEEHDCIICSAQNRGKMTCGNTASADTTKTDPICTWKHQPSSETATESQHAFDTRCMYQPGSGGTEKQSKMVELISSDLYIQIIQFWFDLSIKDMDHSQL